MLANRRVQARSCRWACQMPWQAHDPLPLAPAMVGDRSTGAEELGSLAPLHRRREGKSVLLVALGDETPPHRHCKTERSDHQPLRVPSFPPRAPTEFACRSHTPASPTHSIHWTLLSYKPDCLAKYSPVSKRGPSDRTSLAQITSAETKRGALHAPFPHPGKVFVNLCNRM